MAGPQRIRLSRAKGWRLPQGAVNVARPGPWGNPFAVGKFGDRAQCVSAFAVLARGFLDLGTPHVDVETQLALWRRLRRSIRSLAGCDLACWCALDGGPCHGDVLLHLANGGDSAGLVKFWVDPPRGRLGMMATEWQRLERKKAREGLGL